MKRRYLLLASGILLAATDLAHAGWALGSNHKDLKGKAVVAAALPVRPQCG